MKSFTLQTWLSDDSILEQPFTAGGVVRAMNLHRRYVANMGIDISIVKFIVIPS